MNFTARSILSATTAFGLTAFSAVAVFSPQVPTSIAAAAFGLLAIYGVIEMMIISYAPRRPIARNSGLRVVAPVTTVRTPAVVAFPTECSRSCAA